MTLDTENGLVNLIERRPDLPWHREMFQSRVDNFEEPELDMCWLMQRPPKTPFHSLTEKPGSLRVYAGPARAEQKGSSAAILRRQQHNDFHAATVMNFTPANEGDEAGILLTQNERFSFLLVKERVQGSDMVTCYRIANSEREVLARIPAPQGRLYLGVEGCTGSYSFFCGSSERSMKPIAENVDGSLLSTLVADGFVGVLLGMYAAADQGHPPADFDWFRYEMIEE